MLKNVLNVKELDQLIDIQNIIPYMVKSDDNKTYECISILINKLYKIYGRDNITINLKNVWGKTSNKLYIDYRYYDVYTGKILYNINKPLLCDVKELLISISKINCLVDDGVDRIYDILQKIK